MLHAQVQTEYACLRDDAAPPSVVGFDRRKPVQYSAQQASCWITSSEVQTERWRVLDVRQDGAAHDAHLEGTTKMVLTELQDKIYMRQQSLLLVGSGVDLSTLTQTCVRLRQQGFDNVRVLLGGARNWHRTKALDLIAPQELWVGGGQGVWRLATLGLTSAHIDVLPEQPAVVLPSTANLQDLQAAMARSAQASPMQPTEQWLIVATDDRKTQASIMVLAQQEKTPVLWSLHKPVAWLAGGWSAYHAYLTQQKSVAAHAGRPLPRHCGA